MLSRSFNRSFHLSSRVLNYSNVKLTLFSKKDCGLCVTAKVVLDKVVKDGEFDGKIKYTQVDIEDPKNKEWWDKYCFDIPVLHIEDASNKDKPLEKIFHRMKKENVVEKIKGFK
ncbi:hypothetical protein Kpol_1055p28 [Vanderwaltozyma polyspora DSM 70294]|uniref:Glutaredoxin-like protein n=1 Tax=Vanderwaltozyma polyspora (strain ATCC 22028 / DSM 70294 / BCRC 21397 / CBS 2163 / NBRC 10782 / NRRL Y-8283 / UCD 57-17) TaxID=436907 RepID=A7TGA3_VANPO|nr:uncharacterized protein Kpol_1055p28 [Vanderwaltozyma polyspora DSM 70294]EDO18673.1 hypothetical protein Kpol_1055p28 [Vanderwaltozyma polyspora DSM 70294]